MINKKIIKNYKIALIPSIIAFSLNMGYTPYIAAQEKKVVNLRDSIVVTADRDEKSIWDSSVSVYAVDREDIEKQNGDSVIETLRDIPGIEISDNALAGRKQIMIRGESPSHILLLIDGQEVSYHRSGHGSAAGVLINMESVERVEVIKGPYSVLYGSQAIGGVVNFITRKGSHDGKALNGQVKFIYNGATDGLTEMGSVYGSVDDVFDYRISGTYSEQGDRNAYQGRLDNTDFDNNSLSTWFGLNLDKHKFGLSLDRYEINTQTYVSEDQLEGMDSFLVALPGLKREKIGLFYDYSMDNEILKKIHIDGYYQTLKRTFINQISMSNPDMVTDTQTNDKQRTKGINLQLNLEPTEKMKLIVGAQYVSDAVDQTSDKELSMYYKPSPIMPTPIFDYTKYTISSNSWAQQHFSLFAQNDWEIADNWNWNIGLRQYWVKSNLKNGNQDISCVNRPATTPCTPSSSVDKPHKDHDNTLVASTGLTYHGFDNMILRASFGQGYVYPTLTHLYAITSAHTQTIYGNSSLEAEKSNNYEIGLRYNDNSWLLDTGIYYSTAKNYITQMSCNGSAICNGATGSTMTYYDNADRAKSYGLEFSLEYLGWDIIPYFKGHYLRREIQTDAYTTYDTGNPKFTGTLGLKHTIYLGEFDIDSDLFVRMATSADKYSESQTYHYASWSTLNLSMAASFGSQKQYQVGLDLNNILNKDYTTAYESIPAAKFHALISASIKF